LPPNSSIRAVTRGHVVVRDGPDGRPESWTPLPGRYVVAAWAGDALLVYRLRAGPPDLLALRPGGRARELGRTGLVAVSPDGSRIAVSDFGAQPPRLRVLDARTARELARLAPAELRWVAHAGSWLGGEIAAATDAGVVVFRFAGGSLTLVETIPLEAADLPRVVEEPQLAGDAIAAWGELESQPGEAVPSSALVDYDRTSRTWRRVATGTSLAPPRPAYNPSRP
jgi:hypothetical protein